MLSMTAAVLSRISQAQATVTIKAMFLSSFVSLSKYKRTHLPNKITIKPRVVQPGNIKGKIEEALKRAAEREAEHITIEVQGSRVILSGKVRSFAEMRAVRGAAWSTPGVTSVDDTDLYVAA